MLDNGLLRVEIDERGLVVSVVRPRGRPRGRRARRGGQPAPAPPGPPEHVGRLGRRRVLPQHRHRPDRASTSSTAGRRRRARSVRRAARFGASTVDPGAHAARRAPSGSTSTPRSTGTRREKFLKVAFPLDVQRRAVRRRRPSSATSTGPPTPTPAGRRPSSRSAPTAACTSASRARASRWSTTRRTATTSPARSATDGGTTTTVRLSLLRAPRFPDPETDQGVHRFRYALVPGADDRRRGARGLPDQPARAAGRRRAPRWRRWSRSTTTRWWSRRSSWPTTGSGDVVVRLYESRGGRAAVPARRRLRRHGGAARPTCSNDPSAAGSTFAGSPVELTLRPFQVVTLRFSLPGGDQL